ncbi:MULTISPECIES: hypothetical protein [Brevundimonas]|uniref:hypothetical protein n=1 Tax=Brevundimonas TaxID=41275 RepID=UPI000F0357AE|nr:hypothetical protein [Brevundimonas lutea]
MGQIEQKALEFEVVERLAEMLRQTPGRPFSTTEALAYFTTILAWVIQRVKKSEEHLGADLKKRWKELPASDAPWSLPSPLDQKNVFDALDDLRNASAHAGLRSSKPVNEGKYLVGFELGGEVDAVKWTVQLHENELRRIGALVAAGFVAQMRSAGKQ